MDNKRENSVLTRSLGMSCHWLLIFNILPYPFHYLSLPWQAWSTKEGNPLSLDSVPEVHKILQQFLKNCFQRAYKSHSSDL